MTLPDSSISRIMEQWVEASRLRLAGEQHSTTTGAADVLVDETNRLRRELNAAQAQRDEALAALQRLEQALAATQGDLAALQLRYEAAVAEASAAVGRAAPAAPAPSPAAPPAAAAQATPRFDEQWYLATYPDVRDAVRRGVFYSGEQHFELHGRSERRQTRSIAR